MIISRVISSRLINQSKFLKCYDSNLMVHRFFVTRRAVLFVPCSSKKKVDNALSINVDCIAFDLQNIEQELQEQGRKNIYDILGWGKVTTKNPEWCVAVNEVQSGKLFLSDLEAVFTAEQLPGGIILPSIDNVDLLRWFAEQVWKKLIKRPEESRGPIQLLITIGSALGVTFLKEICEKLQDLATMAPIIPSAIIFDRDKYIASVGGTKTQHGIECLYARQKVVLVGRAFGFQVIDITNDNSKSFKELEQECLEGTAMGYTGKKVLYPVHVPIVQKYFIPSRSKILAAKITENQFKKWEEADMGDFTPEKIQPENPQLKCARYTLHVAAETGKMRESSSREKTENL